MTALAVVFWISAGLIVYTQLGYALLLALILAYSSSVFLAAASHE
jgi:hypothetical protein